MSTAGRFVRFEPKTDNANQVISAAHINKLQGSNEAVQQGIFKAQDRDFLDKALFVLEHHRGINGMWIDVFENTRKIDVGKTKRLVFSETEQGIVFPDGSQETEGYLYSQPYVNQNQSSMKKVMVIASAFTPAGTAITVEISNNGVEWMPVVISDSNLFEIATDGARLMLRATFTRTSTTVSPRLDAWAIMFHDPRQEIIEMPDGSSLTITPEGEITEGDDIINVMHHQLLGINPDDHHPQEHSHDGTDGSGLVSHNDLTDIGEDDHHDKDHQHGQDGVAFVNLESDVIGTLPIENLSYQMWTGKPGQTGLFFSPQLDDKLVYVKTPDDETYMFYDLVNNRLSHTITIVHGVASWETMQYGEYINSKGDTTVILQGTTKEIFDATSDNVRAELDKMLPPGAPTGLTATDAGTGGTVLLSWDANPEVDLVGYNVYQSTDNGVTWIARNIGGVVSGTSHIADGLTDGQPYLFALGAVDTFGFESSRSAAVAATSSLADTIAPAQVMNPSATSLSGGSIKVLWDPNTETDLASYNVYQSNSGAAGTFTLLQTVAAPSTEYVDLGRVVGNTYFYYVTAVDTNGNESDQSIIVSVIA